MSRSSIPTLSQPELQKRAREAVRVFQGMIPGLTGYTRAITGDQKLRVQASTTGYAHTDGNVVSIPPPLDLADRTPHDRSLCDYRDDSGIRECKACAVREEVLVNVYHEIAHVAYGTFSNDKNALKSVKQKSEYHTHLLNALEDARVDNRMFEARAGIKPMMFADTYKTLSEYTRDNDGEILHVRDLPLVAQITMAVYFAAAGYDRWQDFMCDKVVDDLADKSLLDIIMQAKNARSVDEVARLIDPTYNRLVELGYFEQPEQSEISTEENEESDDREQGESGDSEPEEGESRVHKSSDVVSDEGDSESDGLDSDGVSTHDTQSAGDGDVDSTEAMGSEPDESYQDSDFEDGQSSDTNDSSEDCSSEGADSADSDAEARDGRDPDTHSSVGSGENSDSEQDESSASDETKGGMDSGNSSVEEEDESGESGGEEGDRGSGDLESEGNDSRGADGGEGSGTGAQSDDGNSNESTGSSSNSGPGDEESQADREPSGTSASSGESSDSSPSTFGTSSESDSQGNSHESGAPRESESEYGTGKEALEDGGCTNEGSTGSSRTGEDVQNPTRPSEGGQSQLEGNSQGEEAGESVEGFDDEGVEAVQTPEGDGLRASPPMGDTGDVAAVMSIVHESHESDKSEFGNTASLTDEQAAVLIQVIQGKYFETPSYGVLAVEEYKYPGHGWNTGGGRRSGSICDMNIDESILGPALLRTRRVFSDNKLSSYENNRRSGRVNQRVLGRRAWNSDDRLFGKRVIPGKKDYAVQIMMDISSSNMGTNLVLLKRSVMAQAEICSRLGINFSIVAHSAQGIWLSDNDYGFQLNLHEIKSWRDPWDIKIKKRLEDIGCLGGNLDGHALEIGRRRFREVNATDKILLYYTDGKMPAANHDEELVVLQTQIKKCKADGILLLGVGIRTDSPKQHGLDTVRVSSESDIAAVVDHLGKRLASPIR